MKTIKFNNVKKDDIVQVDTSKVKSAYVIQCTESTNKTEKNKVIDYSNSEDIINKSLYSVDSDGLHLLKSERLKSKLNPETECSEINLSDISIIEKFN